MYLAHQMTLLGSVGPYGRPTFQFLLGLACLVFGLSIGSLIVILRRGVKSQRASQKSTGSTRIPLLQTKAGRIGKTAMPLVLTFLGGIAADQIYRHYTRDYKEWKANAEVAQRVWAAYLANHPQYQQDKVNK